MKRLDPLTSIRFFAALLVVLFHAKATFAAGAPAWLASFLDHGYVGVNLFFVLSGFILTYNYIARFQEKTVSHREFLVARFARLYPVFLFALVLSSFKAYQEAQHPGHIGFGEMALAHLTLVHAWFPSFGNQWIGPAWSISTEFFFYLAFPFLILPIARLDKRQIYWALAAMFALSAALPFLFSVGALEQLSASFPAEYLSRAIRWWPICRLPEFLVGAVLCRLFLDRSLLPAGFTVRKLGRCTAAALIGGAIIMCLGNAVPLLLMNQVALTVPFGLAIWFLAYGEGAAAKWLSWSPLVLLGEASYSLYLLHVGVLFVGRQASSSLGLSSQSVAITTILLLAAVLLSVASYMLVETPCRRWIVKRFGASRLRAERVPSPQLAEKPVAESKVKLM